MSDIAIFEDIIPCVSPRRVDANINAIRRFAANRDGVDSVPFSRAICSLQSPEVTLTPAYDGPRMVWSRYEKAGVSFVLRDLMAAETLDPDCAYTASERQRFQPVIRDGLQRIHHHFPETFRVFCNAIPFFLMAKKNGYAGGSVSSRLGFVWLAPTPSWTQDLCGEHLFHEYVHQCLFLDDLVRAIFRRDTGAMSDPGNMIVSAVRGVPRRYDQSYHSAFVATGIIEFRVRTSKASTARTLFPKLWQCLAALVRKRHLLTDNGAEQLDRLIKCVFRQADYLGIKEGIGAL